LRLQSPRPEVGDQFGLTVAVVGDKLAVGAPGSAMGTGKVFLFDATTGAHARTLAKQTPLPGDRFGASLAVMEGGLLIGAPGDGARVTAGGAAYVFDPDSGALRQTLRKAEPEAGDLFGTAVAATAGQVIVGSLRDDVGIVDGGAAYLYAGGVIEAVFRKRLPLAAFGSSLAVAGGDLLVGAPRDAGGKGAVHRFDATSGEARASAESPVPGEPRFGFAVAALGTETLGAAPFQDGPEGAEVGAVHGFEGSTFRRTVTNPSPVAGDQFGFSLLGLGTEFLVGAPLAGERDTGAVYLFDGASGRRRVTFQKPAPVTGDFFGAAVAGDADAILVGAPFDSTAALNAGAAYIFSRASAELDKAFFAPQPAAGDLFGSSLVLAGSRILIGAPLADAAVPDAGRVYLFDRTTGGVLATLENPTPDPGDEFGAALVLAGNNVLIGAPRDDAGALDTGAAYLFEVATGALLQTFRNPAQGDFDQFGFAVTATRTGFLVGAPGPSRVYVFDAAATAASSRSIAIAPRGVVGPDERCGNGLVEGAEECDDGNGVDTDDCRTDCTSPICCTIDPLAVRRCDDGNPCTDDVLDAQRGCTHVENDRCCSADEDCASGKCRVCIGCFLYPWDCCDTGSTCLARTDECSGTECLAGAFCACSGGLSCNGEAVPATVDQLFSGACDQVRLEETFAPEFTPGGQAGFRVAKGRARTARKMTRKAVKLTRRLAARGELSKSCRSTVLGRLKTVKRAIPRNRRLRRCLRAG
jgi:cysteine-rich repeat protein